LAPCQVGARCKPKVDTKEAKTSLVPL
jgi:hypothetical protein